MRKKSSIITTIIFTIILLVGLSVMLYPIISNWWNSKVQSRAVANYNDAIVKMDNSDIEEYLAEANEYNSRLAQLNTPLLDYDQLAGYNNILDISGTGIIGYITIPVIKVEIPIYHGTSDSVLNIAAGHLEGSSFPIGGSTTHAVISAHRGLPSAKLFSDLDQLVEGDTFTITVLNDIYTYEIDKISIVLPHEVDNLAITPNEDYVTLMTCTPYGVNSHRLLLRAHRIETLYQHTVRVNADAMQVDPLLVVPLIAAPLIIMLFIYWSISSKMRKHSNTNLKNEFLPSRINYNDIINI